jgi:phage-related protein
MSVVGSGVIEIRVHAENEYRALYVAKFAEAVYVLHAFVKETRKTSPLNIDWARNGTVSYWGSGPDASYKRQ